LPSFLVEIESQFTAMAADEPVSFQLTREPPWGADGIVPL